MKKLFFMLISLFMLYLGIQVIFFYLSDNETNEYKIVKDDNVFNIKENSNFKSNNNYTYNIKIDGIDFDFQIFNDYSKSVKVIKDIKFYKDNNKMCILPIFKDNKILIDMICLYKGEYIYYNNIKGQDDNLDNFVDKISNYDINQFIDKSDSSNIEGLNVYRDNLVENHYLGLNNYKGIYVVSDNINSTVYNISLFDKDIYNQKLGIYYKNYYIVADYNKNNVFNEFKIIDLVDLKSFNIKSDYEISFDSKMFVEEEKVYIEDYDSSNIYEIDLKNNTVILTSKKDAKNIDNNQIVKINDVGYTYSFVPSNNKYKVYRTDLNNKGKIYLFETSNLNINYLEDYVYFINGNNLNVYNDKFGIKKILEFDELKFNENLKFNVYKN